MSALVIAMGDNGRRKFATLTQRERAIVAAAVDIRRRLPDFQFRHRALATQGSSNAAQAEVCGAHGACAAAGTYWLGLQAQMRPGCRQQAASLAQAGRRIWLRSANALLHSRRAWCRRRRMQAFLQGLLAKNRAIELLSLKTLPVTLVGAAVSGQHSQAAAATSVPAGVDPGKEARRIRRPSATGEGIYQHGIEIEWPAVTTPC
jgi:MSHA biogenesis protein MshJ